MVYILAEMAASHDGSLEHAKEIIDGAIAAGADGILFQVFDLDSAVEKTHADYEDLKSFHMSFAYWRDLLFMYWTKIDIWINVGDLKTAQWCKKHQDKIHGFKLHASKLNDDVLVTSIRGQSYLHEKPILFPYYNLNYNEICNSWPLGDRGIWMYGFQNFPTNIEDLNLKTMRQPGDFQWGYADHSEYFDSTELCIVAMALGAQYLEVHLTWCSHAGVQDTESALNPGSFENFVRDVRRVEKVLTRNCGEVTPGEKKYQQYIEHVRTRK